MNICSMLGALSNETCSSEYFMDRVMISCHMLKLKSGSATSWENSRAQADCKDCQQWRLYSTFPHSPHFPSHWGIVSVTLLLVFSTLCVCALSCPSDKSEAIPSFYVLSSKMSSAIFTSCFELSCVSCPLTKQKLADLMCIIQLKKD